MGEQLNSADLDSIDIHSIERYLARGYPWAEWDLLRRDAPVYWYDRPGIEPFWAITRYEDVHAVGRAGDTFINSGPRLRLASIDHDRKLWASKSRRDSLYDWDPAEPIDMVFMDDPRHLDFRLLMARAFTPAACRRIAERMDEMAARCVAEFEEALEGGGQVDLVEDLAVKLPLETICELIGVPADDWSDVHRWTDSAFNTDSMAWALPGESLRDMRKRLRMEFFAYLENLIADKRANPGDDLATKLVHAEVDGNPLSQQQLHGYLTLLISAGNETTRNASSRGVLALMEDPDQLQKLTNEPDRWVEPAVEEILRWTSPVIQFARTATRDVEIHGQLIREGDTVGVWYPSANRDESVFDRPYEFDITREPNYHLAFGHGPHFCLGANLARWELRALIRQLSRRDILHRIAVTGEMEWMTDLHVGGLSKVPVSLVG
jgi:cholest-4-en-3-one 26-monooxygenase